MEDSSSSVNEMKMTIDKTSQKQLKWGPSHLLQASFIYIQEMRLTYMCPSNHLNKTLEFVSKIWYLHAITKQVSFISLLEMDVC